MDTTPRFPDGTPVSWRSAPSPMYARMLRGDLYQAADPAIAAANARGMALTGRLNAQPGPDEATRTELLAELLGYVGEGVTIRPPFHVDYGSHISVGAHTFMNFGCQILDTAPVTIGPYCQLAPGVILATAYHPVDPVARAAYWEAGAPITLEANVWLGAGVTVLGGVTIGENTVVGAGSVVTRDLPADVVAVGTPARPIRDITDADRVSPDELPDGAWNRLDYSAYPQLARGNGGER